VQSFAQVGKMPSGKLTMSPGGSNRGLPTGGMTNRGNIHVGASVGARPGGTHTTAAVGGKKR